MDFWTSGKASACCVDLWVLEYDAEETKKNKLQGKQQFYDASH